VYYTDKHRQFEIFAVILTGLMKFVFMGWLNLRIFYIVAACVFWIFYIYKLHEKKPDIYKEWGFQKENLVKSFLVLLPFAVVVIIGIYFRGVNENARFLNWHIIPILIFYPLWGLFQQFMVAGLIAANLKAIAKKYLSENFIIFLISLLFALLHYPSIQLMIYVFLMEIIFLWVYFKWKNLWSLGFYHGFVSGLFLYYVMDRDLWVELWEIF
jgi:hypothetical protein